MTHSPAPAGGLLLSLADDPAFLTALEALDRGVFERAQADPIADRPPLVTQLIIPCGAPARRFRWIGTKGVQDPRSADGRLSVWAASWIILATLSAASIAGFVFHAQLSTMVDRWSGAASGWAVSVSRASIQ